MLKKTESRNREQSRTHYSEQAIRSRTVRAIVAATAACGLAGSHLHGAPISLTGNGGPSTFYTQNFDALISTGTGTFTNDSTIAGWHTSRTSNGTAIAAGTGSSTTGNLYSFGSTSASDRALGSVASNGASTGGAFAYGALFSNDTTKTIDSLTIGYAGEQWRDGGGTIAKTALNGLTFSYRVGGTTFDVPTNNGSDAADTATGFTADTNLNFVPKIGNSTAATLDGNLAANRSVISDTISSLSIAPGASIWIRWYDPNNSGSDHALGIDDFSIAFTTTVAITPANVTWATTTGTWDTSTGNWTGGTPTANLYKNGDTANFSTIASDSTVTVVGGGVTPAVTNISNAANTYTFTGGTIGGAGALTKTGNGSAVLSATNAYSGGTNLNGGILVADGGDDRLGASTGAINFNGGTLKTASTGITSARAINVAAGGGTFDSNGLNSSTTGLTTFTAATFTKAGTGDLALNGTVAFDNTSALIINSGGSITLGQSGGTITMKAGGVFNGDLIINTTARLNLDTAGQTYGGAGQIKFLGSALGAGSGGIVIPNTGFAAFNALITNASGDTAGTITSDVVLNPAGNGHVAFTAGDVTTSNYTTASYLIFVGGTNGATGDGLSFNGKITGEGDLFIGNNSKIGGGGANITFNAANDYAGNTLINTGGVIKLGVNQALPAATNVVFGSLSSAGNATLDLNGKTLQIASLSDDAAKPNGRNLTVTNLGATDSTLTVSGSITPANAFGGVISDGTTNKISLEKSGSNTLKLAGVNTFTGDTSVHGGTLVIESTGSVLNSNVIVDGTAVLELDSNSTLGDLKSLTFADSATGVLNFTGAEIVGSLTIGGVTYTSGLFDASTNSSVFSGSGSILVPEPTSLSIIGLVGAGLLARRRRAKQTA